MRAVDGDRTAPNRIGQRTVAARARSMTVVSLLRPGGIYVQRLVYAIGRRRTPARIRDLSFIHFARLAVIRRFPRHGQTPDALAQPLQLFESNYNGTFSQYIDSFVDAVPEKMRSFWGTSYGFPWGLPLTRFKDFIEANEFTIDHYYVAYPDASATMIGAALYVMEAHEQFRHHAEGLEPQRFLDHYRDFVIAVQEYL
jgi:hypothetical protein